MKQVLIQKGHAVVEDVPAPVVDPGTVVVRVSYSCISVGTEMSGVRASAAPLWKRAVKQPQNVVKVAQYVMNEGVARTWNRVEGKLTAGNPTGYSVAGHVIAAGRGIDDLQVGDAVACAGAQFAHHAEYVRVPRNLSVRVPDGLDLSLASTVTLGAIAMQGVRRANPTLGETFVVIGLGILGQLTVQMLRANGCRTIGIDLSAERVRMAEELGMDVGVRNEDGAHMDQVARLTDGLGADGVIITAATPSNEVMSTAFAMCRRKGRVVLVGDVGLDLKRGDFYAKEIDFLISTSYGPGRYDSRYEEQGYDYPVAYVRWTENRNMGEYLRLVADKRIQLAPLVTRTYPVDKAGEAYASLQASPSENMIVLLAYPEREEAYTHSVRNPAAKPGGAGGVRVALIGAGGFAKGMHLPNMQQLSGKLSLATVVSRTGHNAVATARQFNAAQSSTDPGDVLSDPNIDAVLIATRHDTHGALVLRALESGKNVFVEKPLTLSIGERDAIAAFYETAPAGAPILLTGFNRRFSPFALRLAQLLERRTAPMVISYRMNAGHIPLDHWVHGVEGGGRNLGEACHIYDLFTFLTGARATSVTAQAIGGSGGYYAPSDNFIATIKFDDGSIASLTYTALGAKDSPKEMMDVYSDGRVLTLNDYKTLTVTGAAASGITLQQPDKGQKAELEAFADAVIKGGEWPIPLWQQLQATEIAFDVERQIRPASDAAVAQ